MLLFSTLIMSFIRLGCQACPNRLLRGKKIVCIKGRYFAALINIRVLQGENIISRNTEVPCLQELDMAVAEQDILPTTAAKVTVIAAVKSQRFPIDLQLKRP